MRLTGRRQTWRERAAQRINAAVVGWLEDHGKKRQDLARLTAAEWSDLEKHISRCYPFGERAMHPYKMWLAAVGDFRAEVEHMRRNADQQELPWELELVP